MKNIKQYVALLLCVLLPFSFTGCSSAPSHNEKTTLDIDYLTVDGYVEENGREEESSKSLFGALQEKLAADAKQPAATQDALQNDDLFSQGNDTSSTDSANAGATNSPQDQTSSPGSENPPPQTDDTSSQPNNEPEQSQKHTVTMHIRYDTAVSAGLHEEDRFKGILNQTGVFLPTTTFEIEPNVTTVFDVLCQARDKYSLSVVYNGGVSSPYIEEICHLGQYDIGPLSGWLFSVNDWYPNFASNAYYLQPGDKIKWNYTTDQGKDLGVESAIIGG